ncbi:MAG: type I methionyl aminopeptidase [Vicinamibacteria bacterium]|nr:type I methionyl aminopeptidase [Vicinamibacteria bacterium]
MTTLRSFSEMETMHRACSIVVETLAILAEHTKPGVTTKELDLVAAENLRKHGAKSAFLGYHGFPATLCVSVNEEVVHGIPGKRVLNEGDIVGLDFGAIVDGYYGDAARTVAVGQVSPEAERLMKVTQESLMLAIETAHPGKRLGDIGHAVESHAVRHGYTVVRELSGHGIGRKLHEDPQVPNYGPPGKRERLQPGMCLALEPMVNAGAAATRTLDDKWTVVTEDRSLSAHYELTIAVTEHGPWVLSEPYPFAQSVRHA